MTLRRTCTLSCANCEPCWRGACACVRARACARVRAFTCAYACACACAYVGCQHSFAYDASSTRNPPEYPPRDSGIPPLATHLSAQILRSAERYDPEHDRWGGACAPCVRTFMPYAAHIRVGILLATQETMRERERELTHVLPRAYTHTTLSFNLFRWVQLPSMLQDPRAFLGVVALDGLVFALGGQDDSGMQSERRARARQWRRASVWPTRVGRVVGVGEKESPVR